MHLYTRNPFSLQENCNITCLQASSVSNSCRNIASAISLRIFTSRSSLLCLSATSFSFRFSVVFKRSYVQRIPVQKRSWKYILTGMSNEILVHPEGIPTSLYFQGGLHQRVSISKQKFLLQKQPFSTLMVSAIKTFTKILAFKYSFAQPFTVKST